MKQLTCEMCGSTDLTKQDGVFVCQTCGCKYSVEEAKQMIKEVEDVVKTVESATKTVKEATNLFKEYTDNLKERNNDLFALSPKKGVEESQYYILEHLRDADYVADDIFENLTFDESQSTFALVAVFGGPITYHWTASSGFDREEKYTEYVEKTEVLKNGDIRRYKEPETRTRIVTDWHPSSGTVSDYYVNHFVIDSNNFSKEDSRFRRHISSSAVHKEENAVSLWQIYKEQENGEQMYDALKSSMPKIKNMAIDIAEGSRGSYDIPGDHVKELHDTADFRLEAFKLIAYPIVKGQYKYKQQSYDFAVDAIDGNSNNVTVDFPIQADEKERHDFVMEKAEQRSKTRIESKERLRNNFIYIELVIAIILIVFLVILWFKNASPSLIFPGLILLFSLIWRYCFNLKFQKEITKLKDEETQIMKQIKQFIQNENNYKKSLRQKSFLDFINNSANEKFVEMAKDFAPETVNVDCKIDKVLYELEEYERYENLKQERKKTIPTPKSAKICFALSLVVALVGLVLMYPLGIMLGDTGFIISLILLVAGPFIFVIIGRLFYESAKSKTVSKPTNSNKNKQSKKKIIIICSSVIAGIIALIVIFSFFGNRIDNDLVGTWRATQDSSISITFKNNGDMIVRSANAVDDELSYNIDDDTVVVTFANNDTETYGFIVEGDSMIFGEHYYSRIE